VPPLCANLNADDSSKSVIYVLSSKFPVIWNVRGERFPELHGEIWVCNIIDTYMSDAVACVSLGDPDIYCDS